MKEETILNSLPIYAFKWPCKGCGASEDEGGDRYNFDEDTNEVTSCDACLPRTKDIN